jgi:glycerol-3-phosphate dehydrogenase
MCVAIALTAGRMGATLANHTQVIELHKETDENGQEITRAATVKDMLTGMTHIQYLYAS